MGVLEFKIIALIVVFFTGLAGGLISLRLERLENSQFFFSLGSALAGGIFLGAGIIHLLPDAAEGFKSVAPHIEYPLAFTLCAISFISVLLLEKVALAGVDLGAVSGGEGSQRVVYPYILTIVLSIHSMLAGVALGAEATLVGLVVIFVAIIAHKGSAAFALGVSLNRGGVVRARILAILIIFSTMTPLGIAIGAAFDSLLTGTANRLFEAVFDCLAAGTFLYIAVLDIIQEEFFDPANRLLKFALLCLGLAVMALLAVWL